MGWITVGAPPNFPSYPVVRHVMSDRRQVGPQEEQGTLVCCEAQNEDFEEDHYSRHSMGQSCGAEGRKSPGEPGRASFRAPARSPGHAASQRGTSQGSCQSPRRVSEQACLVDVGKLPGPSWHEWWTPCCPHPRHCVRVAKEMDSKSIGLWPQGLEFPRCRIGPAPLPLGGSSNNFAPGERASPCTVCTPAFWTWSLSRENHAPPIRHQRPAVLRASDVSGPCRLGIRQECPRQGAGPSCTWRLHSLARPQSRAPMV